MGWAPEFLVVRTRRDPASVIADIRSSIREVAPAQPVADVRTIEAIVRAALREKTLVTSVLSAFSAVALFLTAVGIYGVVASTVSSRAHELGVRMALGARPASVVWLVVRQMMLVAGLSVAAGLATAAASTRLLSSQLYGVTAMDAAAFVTASVVVVMMTAAAAWLPARRAARIDPLNALRAE